MKRVALETDTAGETNDMSAKEGDFVTVTLCDENGMEITEYGKIIEILEDKDPWN